MLFDHNDIVQVHFSSLTSFPVFFQPHLHHNCPTLFNTVLQISVPEARDLGLLTSLWHWMELHKWLLDEWTDPVCSRFLPRSLHTPSPFQPKLSEVLPNGTLLPVNHKLARAKGICQCLNNNKGICHLPLQGLNSVLLQLLTFDMPWREFRVENKALCTPGKLVEQVFC